MIRKSLIMMGLVTLIAPMAHAVNSVKFLGAGSSAMFETVRIAAGELTGVPQFPFNVADPKYRAYRVSIRVTESDGTNNTGSAWVVVNGEVSGSRDVWAYVSLDSTVGVRCYFKNAAITQITTVGTVATPLGIETQYAPALTIDESIDLPADVIASLNGKVVDAGMTDITPIDAKVTTSESLAAGYNNSTFPVRGIDGNGLPAGVTNVVNFNLSARPFLLRSIGAAPIVVFVNKQDTTPGGFGTATNGLNINSQTLAGFYDSTFKSTSDILLESGLAGGKPVASFQREPLSGTYVTFEYCVSRALKSSSSQEVLVDSSVILNEAGWTRNSSAYTLGQFTQGGRVRGTGTGNLVRAVTRTPNSLGYSFWSTGTFAGTTVFSTFYLTVDGVDPISDAYSNGSYPVGGAVTFKNVKNGSYPIWSILRAVVSPTASQSVTDTLSQATISADTTNFVPVTQMRVFRSHRTIAEFMGNDVASNGVISGSIERGADAGGLVFSINNEENYNLSTGAELTERRQ